jgi:hypothetical protein
MYIVSAAGNGVAIAKSAISLEDAWAKRAQLRSLGAVRTRISTANGVVIEEDPEPPRVN